MRKKYFAKLSEKGISKYKTFWHTAEPFLSDKVKSKESIILVNNKSKESYENKVTKKSLNDFLLNIFVKYSFEDI